MGSTVADELKDKSGSESRRSRRASRKSDSAYRTISEVADELNVPQHVLRFWESKFNALEPMKRGGGRRYYRPDDVDLLKKIKGKLEKSGQIVLNHGRWIWWGFSVYYRRVSFSVIY